MVHPNRPYPLYELPRIESLRHMLEMQAHDDPDRISFRFRKGKEIAEKTASGFFRDVCALGTWLIHHGIQEKHVALIDGNSYHWLVVYFAVLRKILSAFCGTAKALMCLLAKSLPLPLLKRQPTFLSISLLIWMR